MNVKVFPLLRRSLGRFRRRDMARLRCKRGQGQNILLDVLLGCLQCCEGLRHLVLLAGELILIAGELFYAAFHDGKINRVS